MSSHSPLKWLLVGTGDIVRKRVADALRSAEGCVIGGIVGGIERSRAIAQEFGGQAYDDLDDALNNCACDAVYIATPVYRHRDEAVKAIVAGKHVLIEKPLGLDSADAQAIVDAADRAGVTAGCAYYRRCFPRYQQAKQALKLGELGVVTLVRTTYHAWFAPDAQDPKRWRVDPVLSGGGPLVDMGSHMFDLIVGLFGLPKTVYAQTDTLIQEYAVEDSSAIVMTLSNGAYLLASFGWNSKTWAHEFEIVGSEARLRWQPADTGPIIRTVGREVQTIESPNTDNVHTPLVQNFVEAVRFGRQPICPLHEAAKTNQLLDAIYHSSQTGQAVTLDKVRS